jgi:hypothetical protein
MIDICIFFPLVRQELNPHDSVFLQKHGQQTQFTGRTSGSIIFYPHHFFEDFIQLANATF